MLYSFTNYRLLEQNRRTNGIGMDTQYTYGKASLGQMPDAVYNIWWRNRRIDYEYDELGRRTKETLVYEGKHTPVEYSYIPGTTMLESINSNGDEYRYEYDALGQITAIYHNGVLEQSYAYDSHNLLTRWEYAYTPNVVGPVKKTITYGYGDGAWKDLLTNYNGQSITYDRIGNPLTYRDGMALPCGARLCLWRTSRLANRRPQRQP